MRNMKVFGGVKKSSCGIIRDASRLFVTLTASQTTHRFIAAERQWILNSFGKSVKPE